MLSSCREASCHGVVREGTDWLRTHFAKGKDRDIGYALAASSCEGVSDVDACTIAVLDVTAAFAAPYPGVTSQKRRFFRVRPSSKSPRSPDHSAYFGSATIFEANPFSRRQCKINALFIVVNARCLCKPRQQRYCSSSRIARPARLSANASQFVHSTLSRPCGNQLMQFIKGTTKIS